jgi:hypothetical protein
MNNMKKLNSFILGLLGVALIGSCKIGDLELQKDFKYVAGSTVDAHLNKTALQYLTDRGKTPLIANDTVFKYMQLGLEYAGMDMSEYTKDGRTFIFLSNNAIRVLPTTTTAGVVKTTSNIPTAGFWFDFPIMEKNPDGSQKYAADGVTPVTHPAKSWSEYSPATVRNYFLYLIGQGDINFTNVKNTNTTLQSILPSGATATKESKLGYLVSSATPNMSPSGARIITYNYVTGGQGFDPEGKWNMRINNGDFSTLTFNDNTTVATGGLIATNGIIHVNATTTYPCRY